MRKILFLFLCNLILFSIYGQNTKDTSRIAKNTLHLELLGNAGVSSFNYDRILLSKNKFKISGRIGISLDFLENGSYPIEFNFLFGKKNNLETGIGYTFIVYSIEDIIHDSPFVYSLGYRFQKPNGGFFFKTALVLFIHEPKMYSKKNALSMGLAFGYTF
jgi:hypothetical protein